MFSGVFIVIGFLLVSFQIEIGILPYITVTAGALLLYFGVFKLRKENRGFRLAHILTLIWLASWAINLVVRALPALQIQAVLLILSALTAGLMLAAFFFICRGYQQLLDQYGNRTGISVMYCFAVYLGMELVALASAVVPKVKLLMPVVALAGLIFIVARLWLANSMIQKGKNKQ